MRPRKCQKCPHVSSVSVRCPTVHEASQESGVKRADALPMTPCGAPQSSVVSQVSDVSRHLVRGPNHINAWPMTPQSTKVSLVSGVSRQWPG